MADDGTTPPGRHLYDWPQRRAAAIYNVSVAVVIAVASWWVPHERNAYFLLLILSAAPFTTPAIVLNYRTARRSPPEHATFWRLWAHGSVVFWLGGAAGVVGLGLDNPPSFLVAFGIAGIGLSIMALAALRILGSKSGQRALSVDVVDIAMAIVAITAPPIYFLLDPLLVDYPVWLVAPFAACLVVIPSSLYLSGANFARLRKGERDVEGMALALSAASAILVALQPAMVLSNYSLPMPLLFLTNCAAMGLLLQLPLWAHREAPQGLDRLPVDQQVRHRGPLAYLAFLLLPPLAVAALGNADRQPWGPIYVVTVLALLVGLGVVRNEVASRETSRLYSELARVAEERRHLLASMVRALEDDRHRMAAELHEQAVESFTTLGTLIQTAYVTLPPDTARTVKEAIAHMQDDLSVRVESLRRLMVAIRPPELGAGGEAGADSLAAALRAFAADLAAGGNGPTVTVDVDAALVLDWSTKTIVYRIAQEALGNVWAHARGASVATVRVARSSDDVGVTVTVTDDGAGLPPHVREGNGLASMRLFAGLGRGEVVLRAAGGTGSGTELHATLGIRDDADVLASDPGPTPRLRLVTGDPERDGDGGGPERGASDDAAPDRSVPKRAGAAPPATRDRPSDLRA